MIAHWRLYAWALPEDHMSGLGLHQYCIFHIWKSFISPLALIWMCGIGLAFKEPLPWLTWNMSLWGCRSPLWAAQMGRSTRKERLLLIRVALGAFLLSSTHVSDIALGIWASLSRQTRRARTPIVLAFIRVVGRTSMLTVVCRSWHGLRRERSAMADGMCWGRGRCPALSSASQLLHSSSWMTFRLVFSHFWLHYEQMTSLPTWRTQSLHGAVCHQCPCLLLCFFSPLQGLSLHPGFESLLLHLLECYHWWRCHLLLGIHPVDGSLLMFTCVLSPVKENRTSRDPTSFSTCHPSSSVETSLK